jgi:hypothetical protein
MKSILLTTKSPSNNFSTTISSSVGSHHNSNNISGNHRRNDLKLSDLSVVVVNNNNAHKNDIDENDDDDGGGGGVIETIDKEQYNNRLLNHGNNLKKQVIRSKIISKNDDKLKRVSASTLSNSGSENTNKNSSCEDHQQRWSWKTNANNNKNNNNTSVSHTSNIIRHNSSGDNILSDSNNDVNDESLSESLENYPLIENNVIANESDSNKTTSATKLINLRKKNGTTLIFQRKSFKTQQTTHPQSQSQTSLSSTSVTAAANEYQELEIESFKKRQSLQWPLGVVSNNHHKFDSKNRHHSWYDSRYQHAIEEEFENSVSFNKSSDTKFCVFVLLPGIFHFHHILRGNKYY